MSRRRNNEETIPMVRWEDRDRIGIDINYDVFKSVIYNQNVSFPEPGTIGTLRYIRDPRVRGNPITFLFKDKNGIWNEIYLIIDNNKIYFDNGRRSLSGLTITKRNVDLDDQFINNYIVKRV